jgi:VIT1/CCC1 family predicted Fe2+/Mn2+ transporter
MKKHPEPHQYNTNLRDMILGGQDGLVNVLGVVLGASAASSDTKVIIAVGLAATFAESISMAAVAYTSFKAESQHYQSELEREKLEIKEVPEAETEEIREIYRQKGFKGELLEQVVAQITSDERIWLEVMMTEELGLQPAKEEHLLRTSVIVGGSAVVGSLIPLLPYFFLPEIHGVWSSILISAITLFLVGVYKAKVTVGGVWRSGAELTIIGILSALAGYAISLIVSGNGLGLGG